MNLKDIDTHDVSAGDATAIIKNIRPDVNNQVLFQTDKGIIVTCDFDIGFCFYAKPKDEAITRPSNGTAYTEAPPPLHWPLLGHILLSMGFAAVLLGGMWVIVNCLVEWTRRTKK